MARAADNDSWRKEYRAATAAGDQKGLRALIAEASGCRCPPPRWFFLQPTLMTAVSGMNRCNCYATAGRRYPADFWLHFTLGSFLLAGKGRTPWKTSD